MKHLLRLQAVLWAAFFIAPAFAQQIITPNIATAGMTFYGTVGKDGNLLACIKPRVPAEAKAEPCHLTDSSVRKMGVLLPMQELIPPGKTYVGFGIVAGDSHMTTYYLYWK